MEYPPLGIDERLSAYLVRQFSNIESKLLLLTMAEKVPAMVDKPTNGKVYYFSDQTPADNGHVWITKPGLWLYKILTAGDFEVSSTYKIITPGTTDFTLIGSTDSIQGTNFTATGVGAGTGTASTWVNLG